MVGRRAKLEKTGNSPRTSPVANPRRFGEDHGTRQLPDLRPGEQKNAGAPAVAERSKHQDKIIKNYYQNRDAIALQRLGELVSELYLAAGKARQRKWKNVVSSLENLKIPPARIEHLVKQDNPALVAQLLEELLAKK
jgi:hypothetical protein